MVKIRIVTMEVRIEEQGTGKHLNEEVRQGITSFFPCLIPFFDISCSLFLREKSFFRFIFYSPSPSFAF